MQSYALALLHKSPQINANEIFLAPHLLYPANRKELSSFNLFSTYGLFGLTCELGFFNVNQQDLEPKALSPFLSQNYFSAAAQLLQTGSAIFSVLERLTDLIKFLYLPSNKGKRFVIVLGRSDITVTQDTVESLFRTGRVAHIFAQNCIVAPWPRSPFSLTKLPLGLENRGFAHSSHPWNNPEIIFKSLQANQDISKREQLLVSFGLLSNLSHRKMVFRHLLKCKYSYVPPHFGYATSRSQSRFYDDISRSVYVACPKGNGLDTHRFWLSLLFGSIPVTDSEAIYDEFHDLPYIYVQDWGKLSLRLASKSTESLQLNPTCLRYLKLTFWSELILARKHLLVQSCV